MENTKIIIENIKRYLEEKEDPKYTHKNNRRRTSDK